MSVETSKKGQKKKDHLFKPGHPGGPGRPAGSRNAATILLDQLADGAASELLEKMIEAAKGGDMRAAELILSRVWPVRKGRPVSLALPAIKTSADLVVAMGALADAVAGGEITPDEGAAVTTILEAKRRAIETNDLEQRIAALEKERGA